MHEVDSIQAWEAALSATRKLSPATFDRWFSGIQLESLTDGVVCLRARDAFHRDWVRDHYLPSVVEHLRASTQLSIQLTWTLGPIERPLAQVDDEAPTSRSRVRASAVPPVSPPPEPARRPSVPPPSAPEAPEGLNQKYTFANFVVGPSNQLAHAAAIAAAGGGGRRYSPLFLCGGTGLGKTHLMQAIAHEVRAAGPDARIVYVSAERFTNEFISAIQNKRMDAFRERYRAQCDILLVDDVQFLAGREQTQEEFFHTFNALHERDRPIVVTSDKYPQALERMEERLVSRFSWGLVADIQVPELETRVAIVRKKAEAEGLEIAPDVAVFLAQAVSSNVRELEGTLVRLAVKASLLGRPVDLAFAEAELSQVQGARRMTSLDDIQRAVCHHFHVRSTDLASRDRHRTVALARHVAMYLAKQRLGVSFPELGRAFGKDHTTVMSAVRKVGELRRTDQQVRAHLDAIERRLANDR
ncbi:MAG: chromosomal replication initiator protein DnaA [Polyangiaceae bacterium]|nr:chromosomal replication initiator protein DnaA [Polyangiaceae bacterium]